MSEQRFRYRGESTWPAVFIATELVLSGKTYAFREAIKEVGGRWDSDEKVWWFDLESMPHYRKDLIFHKARLWNLDGVIVEAVMPDSASGRIGSSAYSFDDL